MPLRLSESHLLTRRPFATLDVLVRFSIAEAKYHNRTVSWGGKGLHGLYFIIIVHH